jgi:hypothetical protein
MISKCVFFATCVMLLSKVFASSSIQKTYEIILSATCIGDCYSDTTISYFPKSLFPYVNTKSHASTIPERSPVSVAEHKKIFNEPGFNDANQFRVETVPYTWLPEFSDFDQIKEDSDYFLLHLPDSSDMSIVSAVVSRENVTDIGEKSKSEIIEPPRNETSNRNAANEKTVITFSNSLELEEMEKGYSVNFYGEIPEYYY